VCFERAVSGAAIAWGSAAHVCIVREPALLLSVGIFLASKPYSPQALRISSQAGQASAMLPLFAMCSQLAPAFPSLPLGTY